MVIHLTKFINVLKEDIGTSKEKMSKGCTQPLLRGGPVTNNIWEKMSISLFIRENEILFSLRGVTEDFWLIYFVFNSYT